MLPLLPGNNRFDHPHPYRMHPWAEGYIVDADILVAFGLLGTGCCLLLHFPSDEPFSMASQGVLLEVYHLLLYSPCDVGWTQGLASFTSFFAAVAPHRVHRYTPPYKTTLCEWCVRVRSFPTACVMVYSGGRQDDFINSSTCSALIDILLVHPQQYSLFPCITQSR